MHEGIGFSADGGTASSRGDGQEAFDLLPECVKELKFKKQQMLMPKQEMN